MKIIIGADFVPTERNIGSFENGNISELLGEELIGILSESDCSIFNLEMPLCDTASPISKRGPNLRASKKSVNAYRAANVDIVCLANNHIMDQGTQGLLSTMSVLSDAGISYVGAGENLSKASMPLIKKIGSNTLGIYACAEHEFSIASESQAGANPFDPLESLDHIADLKKLCDYLIVLYHGGKEFYRFPSPELQRRCRKMIEKGADIIICQHSHCVGSAEEYKGGTIVYGQGNFLFDHGNDEYWNTGLLILIEVDGNNRKVDYLPIRKCEMNVRLASGQYRDEILDSFFERTAYTNDSEYIKMRYSEFAKERLNGYLSVCKGRVGSSLFGKMLSILLHRQFWIHFYSSKNLLELQNNIECEAHREVFLQGLKDRIQK